MVKVEPEKPKSKINEKLSAGIEKVDFSYDTVTKELDELSEITKMAKKDDQADPVWKLKISRKYKKKFRNL